MLTHLMTSFFYYRVAVTNFNHLFPSSQPTPSGLLPLIISRFRSACLCTRVTWLYFFFCYWKYGRLRRCLKLVRVLKWLSQVSTLLFFNIFKWLVIALGPYSRFFFRWWLPNEAPYSTPVVTELVTSTKHPAATAGLGGFFSDRHHPDRMNNI